jgi:hypothetical protein
MLLLQSLVTATFITKEQILMSFKKSSEKRQSLEAVEVKSRRGLARTPVDVAMKRDLILARTSDCNE